jgi:hypothetical protein
MVMALYSNEMWNKGGDNLARTFTIDGFKQAQTHRR